MTFPVLSWKARQLILAGRVVLASGTTLTRLNGVTHNELSAKQCPNFRIYLMQKFILKKKN